MSSVIRTLVEPNLLGHSGCTVPFKHPSCEHVRSGFVAKEGGRCGWGGQGDGAAKGREGGTLFVAVTYYP